MKSPNLKNSEKQLILEVSFFISRHFRFYEKYGYIEEV